MYMMMNLDYRREVADRRRQAFTAAADRHRLRREAKAAAALNCTYREPTGLHSLPVVVSAATAPMAPMTVAPARMATTRERELASCCVG